jgi:hypothetical protein
VAEQDRDEPCKDGAHRVAVVVMKETRKKPPYLISTSIHLPGIDVVKYYARRWKIEQMLKER